MVKCLQIGKFFHVGIDYKKSPAYCVRLDRVPGLSHGDQEKIRSYITRNKQYGTNSIPRRFATSDRTKVKQAVDHDFLMCSCDTFAGET